MAVHFNGSGNEASRLSFPIDGTLPITIACWFNVEDITQQHLLCAIGDGASANARIDLQASGDRTGDPIRIGHKGTISRNLESTTGYSANTWHHAMGTVNSPTSREVWLDNGGYDLQTVNSGVFPNPDEIYVGQSVHGVGQCTGMVAEIAVWNVALTDAERSKLAAGYSPLFIRPGNLVAYVPCINGDAKTDYSRRSSGPLAVTGLASPAAHPPGMIYPKGSVLNPRRFAFTDVPEDKRLTPVTKDWTEQPPAGTKANPKWLARGLNWLWHGNNPTREVIEGTYYDEANTVNLDLGITSEGQGVIGTGTSRDTQRIQFDSRNGHCATGVNRATVGTYFRMRDFADSTQTYLWSKRLAGTGGWFVRKREDPGEGNNGNLEFFMDADGGAGVASWPAHTVNDKFDLFCGVYDGTDCYGYLNGLQGTTFYAGDVDGAINDTSVDVTISGAAGVSWEAAAEITLLFAFHSALTRGELESLGRNPWQLFEPRAVDVVESEELPKLAKVEKPW